MAGATKWIAAAKERMERKGTVGSLRAIAKRRGLLESATDTLSKSDLSKLSKGASSSLRKKLQFARNVNK